MSTPTKSTEQSRLSAFQRRLSRLQDRFVTQSESLGITNESVKNRVDRERARGRALQRLQSRADVRARISSPATAAPEASEESWQQQGQPNGRDQEMSADVSTLRNHLTELCRQGKHSQVSALAGPSSASPDLQQSVLTGELHQASCDLLTEVSRARRESIEQRALLESSQHRQAELQGQLQDLESRSELALGVVCRVSTALSILSNVPGIMSFIAAQLPTLVNVDQARLFLLRTEASGTKLWTLQGDAVLEAPPTIGVLGSAITQGTTQATTGSLEGKAGAQESVIGVPVKASRNIREQPEMLGVLQFVREANSDSGIGPGFDRSDETLLSSLARLIADRVDKLMTPRLSVSQQTLEAVETVDPELLQLQAQVTQGQNELRLLHQQLEDYNSRLQIGVNILQTAEDLLSCSISWSELPRHLPVTLRRLMAFDSCEFICQMGPEDIAQDLLLDGEDFEALLHLQSASCLHYPSILEDCIVSSRVQIRHVGTAAATQPPTLVYASPILSVHGTAIGALLIERRTAEAFFDAQDALLMSGLMPIINRVIQRLANEELHLQYTRTTSPQHRTAKLLTQAEALWHSAAGGLPVIFATFERGATALLEHEGKQRGRCQLLIYDKVQGLVPAVIGNSGDGTACNGSAKTEQGARVDQKNDGAGFALPIVQEGKQVKIGILEVYYEGKEAVSAKAAREDIKALQSYTRMLLPVLALVENVTLALGGVQNAADAVHVSQCWLQEAQETAHKEAKGRERWEALMGAITVLQQSCAPGPRAFSQMFTTVEHVVKQVVTAECASLLLVAERAPDRNQEAEFWTSGGQDHEEATMRISFADVPAEVEVLQSGQTAVLSGDSVRSGWLGRIAAASASDRDASRRKLLAVPIAHSAEGQIGVLEVLCELPAEDCVMAVKSLQVMAIQIASLLKWYELDFALMRSRSAEQSLSVAVGQHEDTMRVLTEQVDQADQRDTLQLQLATCRESAEAIAFTEQYFKMVLHARHVKLDVLAGTIRGRASGNEKLTSEEQHDGRTTLCISSNGFVQCRLDLAMEEGQSALSKVRSGVHSGWKILAATLARIQEDSLTQRRWRQQTHFNILLKQHERRRVAVPFREWRQHAINDALRDQKIVAEQLGRLKLSRRVVCELLATCISCLLNGLRYIKDGDCGAMLSYLERKIGDKLAGSMNASWSELRLWRGIPNEEHGLDGDKRQSDTSCEECANGVICQEIRGPQGQSIGQLRLASRQTQFGDFAQGLLESIGQSLGIFVYFVSCLLHTHKKQKELSSAVRRLQSSLKQHKKMAQDSLHRNRSSLYCHQQAQLVLSVLAAGDNVALVCQIVTEQVPKLLLADSASLYLSAGVFKPTDSAVQNGSYFCPSPSLIHNAYPELQTAIESCGCTRLQISLQTSADQGHIACTPVCDRDTSTLYAVLVMARAKSETHKVEKSQTRRVKALLTVIEVLTIVLARARETLADKERLRREVWVAERLRSVGAILRPQEQNKDPKRLLRPVPQLADRVQKVFGAERVALWLKEKGRRAWWTAGEDSVFYLPLKASTVRHATQLIEAGQAVEGLWALPKSALLDYDSLVDLRLDETELLSVLPVRAKNDDVIGLLQAVWAPQRLPGGALDTIRPIIAETLPLIGELLCQQEASEEAGLEIGLLQKLLPPLLEVAWRHPSIQSLMPIVSQCGPALRECLVRSKAEVLLHFFALDPEGLWTVSAPDESSTVTSIPLTRSGGLLRQALTGRLVTLEEGLSVEEAVGCGVVHPDDLTGIDTGPRSVSDLATIFAVPVSVFTEGLSQTKVRGIIRCVVRSIEGVLQPASPPSSSLNLLVQVVATILGSVALQNAQQQTDSALSAAQKDAERMLQNSGDRLQSLCAIVTLAALPLRLDRLDTTLSTSCEQQAAGATYTDLLVQPIVEQCAVIIPCSSVTVWLPSIQPSDLEDNLCFFVHESRFSRGRKDRVYVRSRRTLTKAHGKERGLLGLCYSQGQLINAPKPSNSAVYDPQTDGEDQALLLLPMATCNGKQGGVIRLARPGMFTVEEEIIGKLWASHSSLALSYARGLDEQAKRTAWSEQSQQRVLMEVPKWLKDRVSDRSPSHSPARSRQQASLSSAEELLSDQSALAYNIDDIKRQLKRLHRTTQSALSGVKESTCTEKSLLPICQIEDRLGRFQDTLPEDPSSSFGVAPAKLRSQTGVSRDRKVGKAAKWIAHDEIQLALSEQDITADAYRKRSKAAKSDPDPEQALECREGNQARCTSDLLSSKPVAISFQGSDGHICLAPFSGSERKRSRTARRRSGSGLKDEDLRLRVSRLKAENETMASDLKGFLHDAPSAAVL